MAKLNETKKQLNDLESKMKSLKQAILELKSASNGDTQLLNSFINIENELDRIKQKADTLKISLNGIGASGNGLGNIKSQADSLLSTFDRNIEKVKTMSQSINGINTANIVPPTTFSSDNATKQAQAYQESLAATKANFAQALSVIKTFSDGINTAINKVIGFLRSAITLVGKVFGAIGKSFVTLGNGVKSIISLFGNLGNRVKTTQGSFGLLGGSATELRSKILLLKGAFDSLFNNSMVAQAKKLMSSIYSINTIAGGNVTQDVIKWAKSYEYAFGLSARDLISDMQELNGVMYGLGMNAENSVKASQNLLVMGQYLASIGFAGGNVDEVISKITSGMKGMTAAIDDLGLSVRDTAMDEFLENLKAQGGEFANISTDFSSLNEQARVYVRYASLIQQFTNKFDVSNFAKGLDTVTGRVSLFKSAVSNLGSVIGAGLMNVFAKLTSFLIPIVNMITNLVSKLFSFFGISTELSESMNGVSSSLGSVGSGLDDTSNKLDEVAKSANKAKGSLQGFDRVNNVTSSSGGSGSDSLGGGAGFDYSSLMDSMIDELNAKAEEASKSFADKLHQKMVENLKNYWNKFNEYAKEITDRKDFDLGFNFTSIQGNLKSVFSNIKSVIKSWGTFSIEIALKIADDINIGLIITKITELMSKVTELAKVFSDVAIPVLREFYDKNLRPIFESIGNTVVKNIDKMISKINEWVRYFRDTDKATSDMTKGLDNLWKVFNGEKKASGVLEHLVGIVGSLIDVVKALWPIVKELALSFADFAKNELLPWILDKLKDLANWLRENKDKIVDLLSKVGSIAWGGFKILVELVTKLVDIIVKYPGVVVFFFTQLLGLKIATWAVSSAAGIGQLITGLSGFASMFGAGGALAGVGTTISGMFSSLSAGITGAVASVKSGLASAGSAITGFVSNSGVLTGAGASTASGAVLAGGMALAGVGMGAYEAKKTYNRREDILGEEGNTTSGKVSTIVGGFLGGSGGGLADETKSAGEKAKQVGMSALKGAAIGGAIGSVIPGVGTAIGAAVGGVVGTVTGAIGGDNISKALNGAWENTKKVVSNTWESIKYGASKAGVAISQTWENIKTGASEKWESIKTTVDGAWENIKTGATNVGTSIGTTWENIKTGASEKFTNIGLFIGTTWENIKTGASDVWSSIVSGVGSMTTSVSTSVGSIATSISGVFDSVNSVVSNVFNNINTFVVNLGTTINTTFNDIVNNITGVIGGLAEKTSETLGNITDKLGKASDKVSGFVSGAGNFISDGWSNLTGKTRATTARTVTSHAVGGSIGGGQLFRANENGQAELIGDIDGSSKVNVANNNMIIKAMTDGVFTGVYNALAEASSQRQSVGGGAANVNVNIDGFGLIDTSAVNELARLISPYLNSNNSNIANIPFTI